MRRALFGTAAALALTGLPVTEAVSQTLEEQQDYFLNDACRNMGFAKTGNRVSAADAAEPLRSLCTFCPQLPNAPAPVGCDGGPPAVTATSGFSSGAAGNADDTAARRRKAALGSKHDSTATGESTLFSGNRYSIFLNLNYVRSRQQGTTFEGGQKARAFGAMLGMDRRIGTSGVVGVATQLESQSGDYDSGGGFDKRTFGALLYGSWLAGPDLFLDMSAGVRLRSVDARRRVSQQVGVQITPATVTSDGEQREFQSALRSGYDLVFGGTSLGPRLAVEYGNVRTSSTVESGATVLALAFDGDTEKSLRSLAGLQASHVFTPAAGVFVLQLNLDWVHEYQDDQRLLSARFAQDLRAAPSRLRYLDAPPDRNAFVGRASLAITLPHGLAAFAGVDALFSYSYRRHHGAVLGVRKEL